MPKNLLFNTIMESAPPVIPPASQTEYFLYFFRIGLDYGGFLKLPSITFNRVVMDLTLEAGGAGSEFFDARAGGPHMQRTASNGVLSFGGQPPTRVLVNNVEKTGSAINLPFSERAVLDVTYPSSYTDDVNVFGYNQGGAYTHAGKLYDIKFYNGNNLVVHYNPTINPTQDLSGNGNHPTLEGSIHRMREDKPLSYLSLNGTSDYIKTPNITFTKVEFDFYSRHPNVPSKWVVPISTLGGTSGNYVSQSGSSKGYVTPPFVDKVLRKSSISLPTNEQGRYEIQLDATTSISGEQYLFSLSGTTDFYDADVYSVKFYNGASLVAHYDMSMGTVNDVSGNNNHATLIGGTWVRGSNVVTNGLIGYWNSKQGFNPTTKTWDNIAPATLGSYNVTPSIPNDVNVTEKGMTFTPSSATANYFSTSAGFGKTFTSLTIEFYVEHTTRGSNPNLSNVINGFGSDYQLFLFSASGVETAGINFTTTTETERTVILSQPTTINVGSYFSLVIDENLGRTRLYQNGVLIGTVSLTSTLDFTNGVFCIGSNVNGFNINGVIDNVRVYERALTDSEITQNFEIKRNIGL